MVEFKEVDSFPYEVGMLPKREHAYRFVDYLKTRGISATVKPGFGSSYGVYVADEKAVSPAKLELLRYGSNPFAKAYNQAAWDSGRTLKRERHLGGGMLSFTMGSYTWSLFSVASIVEVVCLLIYLCSFVPGLNDSLYNALSFYSLYQITEDYQIWRVFTPALLHFSLMHIAFNLVMFEAFARPIERHFGWFHLGYIIVLIAVVSNILQFMFLADSTIFGGLSGVVYGLIGYMGILSRRKDLPEDLRLPQGLLLVSAIFIGLGFFLSGIANLCHLGGLLMGLALGFIDFKRKL